MGRPSGRGRSSRLRRTATLGAAALGLAVALAACHPADEPPTTAADIEVSGAFGVRPTVTFATPLRIRERSATVLIDGEGPPLAAGDPLLIDWIALDGTSGRVVEETWPTVPGVFTLDELSLGDEFFSAVTSAGIGDRVLLLEPVAGPAGVWGSRVVVADLRPARAFGAPVTPAAGLPGVALGDDGAPTVTLPGGDPPGARVEQLLIKGEGAQVVADSVLLVRYVVVQWSDGAVRASTWGPGTLPQTLALAAAVPGLAQGLVDQTVGSQVLLVVPPAEASGDDTLVYVVDILAVVHDPDRPGTGTLTPSPAETLSTAAAEET